MNKDGFTVNIIHTVVKQNKIMVKMYGLECGVDSQLIVYSKTDNDTVTETNLHLLKLLNALETSFQAPYDKSEENPCSDSQPLQPLNCLELIALPYELMHIKTINIINMQCITCNIY